MTISRCLRAICALFTATTAGVLSAQSPAPAKDSITKYFTYAIPAMPGLTFIGSTSEKIARPTSVKDIVTTFANGVDESGKLLQGLAVELGTGLLTRGMDQAEYRTFGGFIRANTALSIGTIKAAGDSASTNLGVGLRVVILNRADPGTRRDTITEQSLLVCIKPPIYDPNGGEIWKQKPVIECHNKAVKADSMRKVAWAAAHWNAWSIGVAGATGVQFAGSEFSRHRGMGFGGSAVIAAPLCLDESKRDGLCQYGQWMVQASHESRDSLSAKEKQGERTAVGARVNLGSERAGFFFEYLAVQFGKVGSTPARTASEWSTGVEWRATDDIWLSTGVGTRYDIAAGKEKVVLLGGLRLHTYSKRKFATH